MIGRTPEGRRRRRLLAWVLLLLLGLLLIAIPGDWLTASFNGRHLLVFLATAGIILETERVPE